MHILATVVSRPTPTRAVIDAGSKALTSDLLGFTEYGEIGAGQARIVSLSEEHGVVDLSHCSGPLPQVGDQICVVPNHTCVVSNLFDRMVFHRDGKVTRVKDLLARGYRLVTTAVQASRIFDGMAWHENAALLLRDGKVEGIVPASDAPQAVPLKG